MSIVTIIGSRAARRVGVAGNSTGDLPPLSASVRAETSVRLSDVHHSRTTHNVVGDNVGQLPREPSKPLPVTAHASSVAAPLTPGPISTPSLRVPVPN
jgi:hypothetical protein